LSEGEVQELADVFALLDIDGSGTIDPQELQAAIQTFNNMGATHQTIFRMIGDLDRDGKGSVNFEEFKSIMTAQMV
jgi:Ca2+-binding EF-hand superfamily protein